MTALVQCTFVENAAPEGGALCAEDGGVIIATNSILSFSTTGAAVFCDAYGVTLSCCDVFGNAGGD